MTTVLNVSGVDKQRFVEYTENNPATYKVSAETQLEDTSIHVLAPGLVQDLGPGDHRQGGQPEEPLPRHRVRQSERGMLHPIIMMIMIMIMMMMMVMMIIRPTC